MTSWAERFVTESNMIEGIHRPPTDAELQEFDRFMSLPVVTVEELEKFVKVYQPNARLRNLPGLNVRIGSYYPPEGGWEIEGKLKGILEDLTTRDPYHSHLLYETLHPFTDGNGRSGRMLWAWQRRSDQISFLHRFYYETLAHLER